MGYGNGADWDLANGTTGFIRKELEKASFLSSLDCLLGYMTEV
jgi:hypothetical protein